MVSFHLSLRLKNALPYFADDCGGLLEGASGIIKTPNYPLNYPLDKVCSWIIKVQPGDKVVLTFQTFVLEDNAICQYDYVLIRDGSSSKSPMIGKFCGTSRPATITSAGNYLWLEFRSDSTATRRGFKAIWEAENFEVSTPPTTTYPSTTETLRSSSVAPAGSYISHFSLCSRFQRASN